MLVGGLKCRTQFWKGTTQGSIQQSLVENGSVDSEEKICFKFHPLFSIFSLVAILVGSRDHWTQFWKGPSKDHSTKVWWQLAQWFLKRRFLCEFPIGSYVKLSSAVGAILVEGPNRRTHFWKRTIHLSVYFYQKLTIHLSVYFNQKLTIHLSVYFNQKLTIHLSVYFNQKLTIHLSVYFYQKGTNCII
jgi:hypothetical protein